MFFPSPPILHFQEIKSNKTVLHLAVKEGNAQLVQYLLRIPLPYMKDFVNLKVSPSLTRNSNLDFKSACVCWFMCTHKYTLYTHLGVNKLSHAAFSPLFFFCFRLPVTQLYTWQLVSMVTPTRRRSCGCC